MHILSEHKCFDGLQLRVRHPSAANHCEMTYSLYLPPQALAGGRVPLLYWLSGLTCTDENFTQKAGAQRYAAQYGLALVMPDTSPRGSHISDSANEFIGQGAGFYIDATEQPWAAHYQMYSHISRELPDWMERHFPATQERSIAGFSMGGHGALSIALKNPGRYAAVSAFAPLCHPTASRGGKQAFAAYLGKESEAWQAYDSTSLVQTTSRKLPILIDQGGVDPLFPDELQPEAFVNAARANGFNVQYKVRPGYGHDYFFIASFIDSHIEFHAEALGL